MAAAALAPELLVQLDPGRFRADNLLGAEDWDAALYGCLDDRLDHAHLFPSLDPDPMFDCAFDGGGGACPPDPPWHQEPPRAFPDLQVKSEPGSPTSSLCSDSSCSSEPQIWGPSPPELGVKVEPPPPLPCAPQELAQPPQGVKAEPSQNRRGTPPGPPNSSQISPKSSQISPNSTQIPPNSTQILPKSSQISPKSPPGPPRSPPSHRGTPKIHPGTPKIHPGTPKIHPKPPRDPPQSFVLQSLPGTPPGAIAVPAPAVLLSSAELLLPGGLLCLPPPAPPGPLPKSDGASAGPPKATIVPAPAPASAATPQLDVKALRRQQRMIKNRESASLSRRRRKEYVQGLEQRLRLALAENERLQRDNGALRRRLQELTGQPPPPPPGPGPRTLACLGALLLLTFHLGPLSLPQATPTEPPRAAPPPQRRHLLEVAEPPRIWGPPPEPLPHARSTFRNSTPPPTTPWDPSPQFRGSPDCRGFNRTESLRLADELRGWVRRHQIHRGTPGETPRTPPRGQFQAFSPWKGSGAALATEPPRAERAAPAQLQLYRGPEAPEPRILAAIERRDDTFYVVSFRRDHLLLPARSHNKTSRPKMSLVMPAAALNDSLAGRGRGLQAMMQVDCEVMDTRVIHVRRRRAPPPNRSPAPSRTTPPNRRPRPLVLGGDST